MIFRLMMYKYIKYPSFNDFCVFFGFYKSFRKKWIDISGYISVAVRSFLAILLIFRSAAV